MKGCIRASSIDEEPTHIYDGVAAALDLFHGIRRTVKIGGMYAFRGSLHGGSK